MGESFTMCCYVAVDENGSIFAYHSKPERYDNQWIGGLCCLTSFEREKLPEELRDMTWADEPKLMTISATVDSLGAVKE